MSDLPKMYDVKNDSLRDVNAEDIHRYQRLIGMTGIEAEVSQALCRVSVLLMNNAITSAQIRKAVKPILELAAMDGYISQFRDGELKALLERLKAQPEGK